MKSAEEVTAEYSRLLRESVARNPFKPIASRAPEPFGDLTDEDLAGGLRENILKNINTDKDILTLKEIVRASEICEGRGGGPLVYEEVYALLEKINARLAPPPLKEGELAVPDSCVSVFADPAPQDDVVNDLAIKFCQQIRGDCWGDLDLDEVRSGLFAAYHRGQQSAQDIRNAALEESACEAECGFLDSTAATGIRGLKSVQPKAEEDIPDHRFVWNYQEDNNACCQCGLSYDEHHPKSTITSLQSQVNKLREGLHTILCNTEDGAISHKDYAHLAKDISDCARAYLADTAPMGGK